LDGIARLNPSEVDEAFPHAPVRIDTVKLDGQTFAPQKIDWEKASNRNLEINFQAAS